MRFSAVVTESLEDKGGVVVWVCAGNEGGGGGGSGISRAK